MDRNFFTKDIIVIKLKIRLCWDKMRPLLNLIHHDFVLLAKLFKPLKQNFLRMQSTRDKIYAWKIFGPHSLATLENDHLNNFHRYLLSLVIPTKLKGKMSFTLPKLLSRVYFQSTSRTQIFTNCCASES